MNRKLFYIITSYFVFFIMLSCNDQVSYCDWRIDYTFTGVKTENIVVVKSPFNKIKPGRRANQLVTLEENERIGFCCNFLDTTIRTQKLYCNVNDVSPFLHQAFGESPSYTEYVCLDSFESLQIRTITDLDSLHKLGSDVSEYFSFSECSLFLQGVQPMDSIVSYLNYSIEDRQLPNVSMLLILEERPVIHSDLKFEIVINMTSGKSLKSTTSPVKLKY